MNPTLADVPVIAQIASGLLASGHYTRDSFCDDLNNWQDPELYTTDMGKDFFKETGMSRYQVKAVEDAHTIWRQIVELTMPDKQGE